MDHFDAIELADCPCCGEVGSIEEEGGWCLYVQCGYCGAHTAELSYGNEAERQEAAQKAAALYQIPGINKVGEHFMYHTGSPHGVVRHSRGNGQALFSAVGHGAE